MTELQETQAAAAKILLESDKVHEQGVLKDDVYIGVRLTLIMLMMKESHQSGARKIVREFCEQVGLNFDILHQQLAGRVYEHVQLARMENDLKDDKS